jgi:D-alanyl-lipoteichoic acid acyltransferase DltB (MBOAT superfamily)
MLFNSLNFFVYFVVVVGTFFLLPHKLRSLWLLLSSCYFYMVFIPYYILILFGTIVIDYVAGIVIHQASGPARKLALMLSLVANVSVLGVFKYYDFIVSNCKLFLPESFFSGHFLPEHLGLVLPIGLSFHTFQAMSYTIEVYRKGAEVERNFVQYALYVMFFPQLVAGPIERPQNILPQLRQRQSFDTGRIVRGLKLIVWGLFKKCVIADRLATIVDFAYDHPALAQNGSLALATVFFGIQIYCDFSGYSDIALGSAEVLGIRLMKNFRRPYFATSLSDFWTRWHVSLSTWFRDYLYIPLGGSHRGHVRAYRNILITFFVSGLWHGAAWTYVCWGGLNGLFLVTESILLSAKSFQILVGRLPLWLKISASRTVTVGVIMITWVFFRARNLEDAAYILTHLGDNALIKVAYFRQGGMGASGLDWVVVFSALALLFVVEYFEERRQSWLVDLADARSLQFQFLLYYGLLVLLMLFGVMDSQKQFIYFQF